MLLAGELGLGSLSKDWMDVKMADTSYVGLHLQGEGERGKVISMTKRCAYEMSHAKARLKSCRG